MTKRELFVILQELELHPSRKLGQNFLIDTNLLKALLRTASPRAGERILEVGPGTGVLTRQLLLAGCLVTAVEIDRRLAAYLTRELKDFPHFRLVAGDACRQDYSALFPEGTFRCIANLPYSCSSPFLGQLLQMDHPPVECFVLLQREMADRLNAQPNTKAYGALTVRTALVYDIHIERFVPPTVFYPPPAVSSAFVCLRAHDRVPAELRRHGAAIAKLAFSQRRKRVKRLLEQHYEAESVQDCFDELSLPDGARAEQLPVTAFIRLATCLRPKNGKY